MIAAENYIQDTILHSHIDCWEIGSKPLDSDDVSWRRLSPEIQKFYIRWVFYLVQTGRLA